MRRFLQSIEHAPLSAPAFAAAFAALVLIRALIESFSAGSGSGFLSLDPSTLVHYGTYFLAVYLSLALILGLASRDYPGAQRAALFILPIVWLPPAIDLLVSGGAPMSYLIREPSELLSAFFSLANPFASGGPTLGQKVATALLLAFVVWYARVKGRDLLVALLSALCLYLALFMLGALPSLLYAGALLLGAPAVGVLSFLSDALAHSSLGYASFPALSGAASSATLLESGFNVLMAALFTLISFPLGTLLLSKSAPAFRAHARNFRPLRVFHFLVLILAGAGAALLSGASLHPLDLLPLGALLFAWCASCYYAVAVNDLEDEEIDRVSSPERPIPSGVVSREGMRDAAALSFAALLLAGSSAGYYPFFFLLAFTASYYVYSASPLRLKRVPLLSSFLIGCAALSAVCAGYFLFYPGREFGAFPALPAIGIVVFYTLFSHFRDLKDLAGDTAAGIPTVAALLKNRFGERGAFTSIGILVALAFLSTPLFFPVPVPLALVTALLGYTICAVRPYVERRLFLLFFSFLLIAAYLTLP